MNLSDLIRVSLFIFLYFTGVSLCWADQHPYERVMAAANYEYDKKIANSMSSMLQHYAPYAGHKAAGTGNYRQPYLVNDLKQAGQLWHNALKPRCEYFDNVYGAAQKEVEQLNWFDYPEAIRDRWRDVQEKFATEFPLSLLQRRCAFFEERIAVFLNDYQQSEKYIPLYIEQFQDALADAQKSSVGRVKAFGDQDASRYNLQFGYYQSLTLLLAWLEDYKPNHPNLAQWKSITEDIRSGFYSAAASYANEVLPKSQLPVDFFSDDNTEQLNQAATIRQKIKRLVKQQYGHIPDKILLRDNNLQQIERFVMRSGKLQPEKYNAIAFVAVLPGKSSTVSTYRGWYEDIVDGPEKVFMIKGQDNFAAPTALQTVTTLDPKLAAAQAKAKADAEFEKRQAAEKEALQQQVAAEVAEAKAKARAEVEAAKKAAQKYALDLQNNSVSLSSGDENNNNNEANTNKNASVGFQFDEHHPGNETTNTSGSGGIMGLVSTLTSLFMLAAGILISRELLLGTMPANTKSAISSAAQAISPFSSKLGLALMALGAISLVTSLLSFSVVGLITGGLVVVTGLLLAIDQVLSFDPEQFTGHQDKAEKLQQAIKKYESQIVMLKQFQKPVGIAALIIGILGLLGSL